MRAAGLRFGNGAGKKTTKTAKKAGKNGENPAHMASAGGLRPLLTGRKPNKRNIQVGGGRLGNFAWAVIHREKKKKTPRVTGRSLQGVGKRKGGLNHRGSRGKDYTF